MTGQPEQSTSTAPAPAPVAARRLPPGMVLGPDGKPCKACNSLRNMRLASASFPSKPPASTSPSPSRAAGSSSSSKTASAAASAFGLLTTPLLADDPLRSHCPADSEQLGRATWTFLHTAAAYYPATPSKEQQKQMLNLLRSLPTLYPCQHCAQHLGVEMQRRPPDVTGREGVSRWLCETHNEVNERLGKERFDCARVLERWRDGPADGSCD
ncbi:FAD-dependent thiol oxidase [Calocera viscosa TUFC12733]|uniref:Sulfhydryl oxidase n=1 Tax=Calocera viscosa (strain TUFC12733) TaxID=1330018 RepID=A0A167S343_CALVF|nr:FAD-dependent thiol oxidase [Calocera viscosa TUFC12733]